MSPTCGNTARAVATCARAWASGAPSATLAAKTPVPHSALRAAAMNSTEVRWAACALRRTRPRSPRRRSRPAAARARPGRPRSGSARRAAAAGAHQFRQRGVDLDGQLRRSRPRRRYVPGQREGPGAQVQHAQRLRRRRHDADHVSQPPDVLEVEVTRVVQVDVRLRDAVDQQHPRRPPVGIPQQLGTPVGALHAVGCGLPGLPSRRSGHSVSMVVGTSHAQEVPWLSTNRSRGCPDR